jgi:excisionase family DNA binding protein
MKNPSTNPASQMNQPVTALTYRINIAMAKLGISRSTIYRMVKNGDLTLVKISRHASGITAESLLAHIERQKMHSQAGRRS